MSATITAELIENKRVLLRADLNLPTVDGEIVSLARWQKILPTINQIFSIQTNKTDYCFSLWPAKRCRRAFFFDSYS